MRRLIGIQETWDPAPSPVEIISTAIVSLPLSQVGQLSVTGESMGIQYVLVNRLESVYRLSDRTRNDLVLKSHQIINQSINPQWTSNGLLVHFPPTM